MKHQQIVERAVQALGRLQRAGRRLAIVELGVALVESQDEVVAPGEANQLGHLGQAGDRMLPSKLYFTSAPIITANWEAESGQQWTVPFGGGVGKLVRIGKTPVDLQAQVFYNVIKPDFAGDWSTRLQFKLLFPK